MSSPAWVHSLVSYPVKGCAGVSLSEATVGPAGLPHDRTFMVVDPDGVARTQRTTPQLSLVRPGVSPCGGRLGLTSPQVADPLDTELVSTGVKRPVTMLGKPFLGVDQGDRVAEWLTTALGAPSRLVRVPPDHARVTDGAVAGTSGFADSCAVHLLSQESHAELGRRLAAGRPQVPLERFRPNLVLGGLGQPHAEDDLGRLVVGDAELRFAKLAIRCVVTTVDQPSGRKTGPEPLRTLATYRRTPDGVAFGTKLVVSRPGTIRVGDPVHCSGHVPARAGSGPW